MPLPPGVRPDPELPPWARRLRGLYEGFQRVKMFVVAWFVRLAWAPCFAWGLWNLSRGEEEDAAIRLLGGGALLLVWAFLVRRGRWSLNRDGVW